MDCGPAVNIYVKDGSIRDGAEGLLVWCAGCL